MYCFKCGNQIPDDSIFCSKCGAKVAIEAETSSDGNHHWLTIDRASQIYAINPPIKVAIDHSVLLSVDNGKTIQTELSEGHHIVELSASMRKTRIELDITRDTLIKVSFSRLTGKIVAEVIEE